MSSNPLMMDYEGGDLTADWRCLVTGGQAAAQSLCVQTVHGSLSDDVLYKSTPLPFLSLHAYRHLL